MINYVDEALFKQDSVDKQISIVSDDQTINITNEDIVSESFEIEESLCSEDNLYFGAVESNCLRFTIRNTLPKMTNKWLTVQIMMQGASTAFTVGRYLVQSDKPSSDRSTRDIVAYDGLYRILTKTYKKWYNSIWSGVSSMTIKQFRDAWFTRLHQTHSWLTQENVTLPNDNISIKKSKKINKPSGRDIFRVICEINGCFGHIGRDNVFHYIRLDTQGSGTDIDKTYTISVEYEDDNTEKIDRLEILSPKGEIFAAAGESADDCKNKYVIQNNFMIKGVSETLGSLLADYMANNLFDAIKDVTFKPFTAEVKGNPCYEVGDAIVCHAHNQNVKTYILNRKMTGVQSLHDEYGANDIGGYTVEYPENPNTQQAQIEELKDSIELRNTNYVGDFPIEDIGEIDSVGSVGDLYIQTENVKIEKYTIDRNSKRYYGDDDTYGYYKTDLQMNVNAFQWSKKGYYIALSWPLHSDGFIGNLHWGEVRFKVTGITKTGTYKLHCKAAYTGNEGGFGNAVGFALYEPNFGNDPPPTGSASTALGWSAYQYGGGWLQLAGQEKGTFFEYDGEFQVPQNWLTYGYFWIWFLDTKFSTAGIKNAGSITISELTIYHEDDTQSELDINSMYVNVEKTETNTQQTRGATRAVGDSNTEWKEIKFIKDAGDGVHLDDFKKVNLDSDVMRAIVKLDPPQKEQDSNKYCIRVTGDPDNALNISYSSATDWNNTSCKHDKEGVYTIKNGGTVNTSNVDQCAYKITGLVAGTTYYFNFAAKFSNGTFGSDFTKGLGFVLTESATLDTTSYTGDPGTFDEETGYFSLGRTNNKRYYDFSFTASASTMYLIVVIGDISNGVTASLVISNLVISKTERKYARSIYLFDTEKQIWISYKPFGARGDDGESVPSTLGELDDVELESVSANQLLGYNEVSGQWENVNPYTLPIASASTLGGIKVGNNLSIDENGVLSATASSELDAVELTQAQYNLLTPEQKADLNKIYFITDGSGGGGGGGGGSSVVVTPILTTGVPIATITVDGVEYTLYTPQGGGSRGISEHNYNAMGQRDLAEENIVDRTSAEVV